MYSKHMMLKARKLKNLASGILQLYSKALKSKYKAVNGVEKGNISALLTLPDHIRKPVYINGGEAGVPQEDGVHLSLDVTLLRAASALARCVLDDVSKEVKVGVTTDWIDKCVHKKIVDNNAYPSPLLYKGFPKSCCTSVNDVVAHGIPDDRPLADGDIVNIDITVYLDGYHGDVSDTYLVGTAVAEADRRLVEVTREALARGVQVCGPGVPYHVIGDTIGKFAAEHGCNVVPEFCGHGIGRYFHGPPEIFHFEGSEELNPGVMKEGEAFTIEPILVDGDPEFEIDADDGWTARTLSGAHAAQFEHTVLVTSGGVEVLTAVKQCS